MKNVDLVFNEIERKYGAFLNRGDRWKNYPPQISWGKYMRNYILNNGETNFERAYIKPGYKYIRPEDKVNLYCSAEGYFGSHYYSSLALFQKNPQCNSAVFIDFGCGPATAGLAFIDALDDPVDIIYIGIDTSIAMCNKAKKFLDIYGIENKILLQNISELSDALLDSYNDKTIVLNFSFLLNNEMFNQMDELLDILQNMVNKLDSSRFSFIYQNPIFGEHDNWNRLKSVMQKYNFAGIADHQLIYNNKQQKKEFKTYYDILFRK